MAPISRHEGRSDGHPVRRRGEFASGRGRGRGRVSITQGQGRGTHTFPGPTNGLEPHGTGQQPSRRRGLQTPRGRGDLAPRAGGSESHISGQGRGTRALSSRTLDRGTGRRGITEHRGRPSSRGRGQGHRPDDRISLEQYLATHPLDKVPIIQQASNSAKSSPQHSDSIAISPSARASSVNNNDTTIAKSSEQADRRISTTPPSTTPPPQSPGSRSELTPLDNAMARIKIKLPPNLTPQNTVTTREENIAGVVPAKEACNKIGNHSPTLPLASIPDLGKRDRAMELIDYDASDEHTATSTRERANEGKKETSVDDMLMGKVEEMRTLEYSIEKRERQVEPAVVERQWEQSSEVCLPVSMYVDYGLTYLVASTAEKTVCHEDRGTGYGGESREGTASCFWRSHAEIAHTSSEFNKARLTSEPCAHADTQANYDRLSNSSLTLSATSLANEPQLKTYHATTPAAETSKSDGSCTVVPLYQSRTGEKPNAKTWPRGRFSWNVSFSSCTTTHTSKSRYHTTHGRCRTSTPYARSRYRSTVPFDS